MVDGELAQLSSLGRMDLRENEVVDLAARKTACLFSGCARLGAVLGPSAAAEEQALADYGRNIGVAFQLVDDLLDFTASPTQLGKPVLSDLKEGKVTLPLIYALESAGQGAPPDGAWCARCLTKRDLSSCGQEISALVRDSGALDRTRQLAYDYVDRAKTCLNGRGGEYGRALRAVPEFTLERER